MPKGRMKPVERVCAICATVFMTDAPTAKYCSPEHSKQALKESIRRTTARRSEKRKAYFAAWHAANSDSVKEKQRAYASSPKGKAAVRKSRVTQRDKFPEKIRARAAVATALKSGRIARKPCEVCGEAKVEAHHADYSTPLVVTWLCRPCHVAEHANNQSQPEFPNDLEA